MKAVIIYKKKRYGIELFVSKYQGKQSSNYTKPNWFMLLLPLHSSDSIKRKLECGGEIGGDRRRWLEREREREREKDRSV